MQPAPLSPKEREEALSRFVKKYRKRGFRVVSRSPNTVELFRPARFPKWLWREQTLFADIEESGWIYVRKS